MLSDQREGRLFRELLMSVQSIGQIVLTLVAAGEIACTNDWTCSGNHTGLGIMKESFDQFRQDRRSGMRVQEISPLGNCVDATQD
jgi:hypothetical protein